MSNWKPWETQEPLPAEDLDIEQWGRELVGEVESYLSKWAAFARWLVEHNRA